jgi:transcriptional regulator with XRE-family HTH domain
MKPIEETVRNNVKNKMAQLGLRQTELAARAKVPHQSIYKILRGIRVPSLAILSKLAIALECETHELLQDEKPDVSNFSRKDILEIVTTAIEIQKLKVAFKDFTKATPSALADLVAKFGGWNFLYDYLQEELEIRSEAERDYQRLRDSLRVDTSKKDLSIAKNKMLISKMIAKKGSEL